MQYVLGFVFDEAIAQVLLVEKQKGPECVRGFWNGVGGKVEPYEHPGAAMRRELAEETNLDTPMVYFGHAAIGGDAVVHLFAGVAGFEAIGKIPNTNDVGEVMVWRHVNDFGRVVPNVKWLLPMAQAVASGQRVFAHLTEH